MGNCGKCRLVGVDESAEAREMDFEEFSVGIEVIQYAFNLGWCEIDDVICNVLGAAIGFGLWKMVKGKINAV